MESECNLPSVKNCVHELWEDRERKWGGREREGQGEIEERKNKRGSERDL